MLLFIFFFYYGPH